jgi:1,4-dihydroxy-2-naphthoate octaprenyltransferase
MFIRTIIKALIPFHLIALVMTYVMGAGLVKYIRAMTNWPVFILGGIFLLLIAISVELLRLMQSLIEPKSWPEGMGFRESKQLRIIIAAIAATFITVATTIFITWLQAGVLWQGLVFLMLALLAVGGLYYFSQASKILKPYVLLFEVLLFVVFPPAMAFFLQSNDLHRYLTMVVISLVPAYLANRLLHLLQSFGSDLKNEVDTLVIQIGWQNAMFYHNALILLAYFLFALIAVLGVHWFIIWPVFLTLPIGLLEIWLMERIRRGMQPLWGVLRFAAACVFFIPVYLIGFAFWIR